LEKIIRYVICKAIVMNKTKPFVPDMALCIILDLIGMATYLIPALGEFADVVWAPVSGFLFYKLFGGRFGMIGGVLNFLEEIIPYTDIIPSFTIAWFIKKKELDKWIADK
jgi:hypothetical protein